jgi:hypothetical protein
MRSLTYHLVPSRAHRADAIPEAITDPEPTRPWIRVVAEPAPRRRAGAHAYRLARGPLLVRLVDNALLARSWADDCWAERTLAPLAHRFLVALCERAIDEAETTHAVRGCMPARALAAKLRFRSRYADEDNVRQVARRVRAVLAAVDAEQLVAVTPRHGYYLDCAVDTD